MLPPCGFVCFVPRESVVPIRMSVEDAARTIISAGMVNPETQAKLRDLAKGARNGYGQPALTAPGEAPRPSDANPSRLCCSVRITNNPCALYAVTVNRGWRQATYDWVCTPRANFFRHGSELRVTGAD